MQFLNWDLSVLSRAIAFPNLSAASSHVGLSQPQLSRIVARLEADLGVHLLDRSSRRRACWTPQAARLAAAYGSAFRQFLSETQRIAGGGRIRHIRVATLEGLLRAALACGRHLFSECGATVVELDVLDLHDLERRFLKGRIELALTSREPGRRKRRHVRCFGYQTLERRSAGEPGRASEIRVLSAFEFGAAHRDAARPAGAGIFVSNSLEARRRWIREYGGAGVLPSEVRPSKGRGTSRESEPVPALLIGAEDLPSEFWRKAAGFRV